MKSDKIEVLLEEYRMQRSLLDQYRLMPYKVIPIAIPLAYGLLIYGGSGKGYMGLAVSLGVVLLLCWFGYIQHSLDFSGLRCVELELRINRELKVPNEDGINWTINALNEALRTPGFLVYLIVCSILGAVLFAAALVQGWFWLRTRVSLGLCLAIELGILVAASVVSVSMAHVQSFFRRKKYNLIKNFSSTHNGE